MFARSLYTRLGQKALAPRLYNTQAADIRAIPGALSKQQRPTSNTLFLYGLPTTSVGSNSDSQRPLFKALHENAKALYDAGNEVGPVGQVITPLSAKNFAWVEFTKISDAVAFKDKYTDEKPFVVKDRGIRIEFAQPRHTVGSLDETSELVLRYNTTGISSEEALQIVQRRFPNAELSTNVKSDRSFLGTIFLRFKSIEDAKSAFDGYHAEALTVGESISAVAMHPGPSPDMVIYNLKPFAPAEEILEPLKSFGELSKFRFAFERFGPRVSGRAYIGFRELSSAKKLFEATLNEEFLIHDRPVRSEYFFLKADAKPRFEGASTSEASSA